MATSMVQVPCTALFTVLAANVVILLWVKTACNALQQGGGMPVFLFALKVRAECTFSLNFSSELYAISRTVTFLGGKKK